MANTNTSKWSGFQKGAYWDLEKGSPLSPNQGCLLSEWEIRDEETRFAVHPSGFPVFLTPIELEKSDEYSEGDPYTAEEGFEKWPAFQNRRLRMTFNILKAAGGEASEPMRILDVACGLGVITQEIASNLKHCELYGIDYSVSAIEAASRRCPDVELAVGNAYKLPYASEFFDVVLCNNIWEHVPDPLRLLDSIQRVLKPGGHVIISTPSRYRFRNMVRVMLGMPVVFMSKHHVTEYSVGQVIEQLTYADMEVKVFDEPLTGPAGSVMRFAAFKMVVPAVRFFLSLIGSHHSPEETVFYLARKKLA